MFTRTFGGLAACLSVAGVAVGQQPAPFAPRLAIRADAPPPKAATAPAPTVPAPGMYPTVPASTAPVYASAVPMGECGPTGCTPDCLPACDCLCGPPGRCWVSAEYLLWSASGQNLPPLVTTAPNGTPRNTAGAIGAPGTSILSGGSNNYNDNLRSGFRLRAGTWLDDCQRFGIEGDFFFLGQSRDRFNASSDGSRILTRPFFNSLQNRQDSQLVSFNGQPVFPDTQLVAFPGVLAGSVGVDSRSNFIGGGVNTLCNLCCDPCGRLDLLLGYRYLNLRDEVVITEDLTALPGSSVPAGTRFQIRDRFRTDNDFHGGNIGFNYERRFGHFFLGVRPSVALGVTHTTVTIDGSTTITPPGGVAQVYPGGLLTQPTNIGRYESNTFSVVPEIGVRVGAQVTNNLRAFISYNYIYWSQVARAGDQIDLRVNTNQIAPAQPLNGPANPAFELRRTGYHVHGVGFGAEYRW